MVLSGNSEKIELKDRRSVFSGLFISDKNVPFCSVTELITHDTDENLIALSCKTAGLIDSNTSLSEMRIYDIRYPKESVMRIETQTPVSEFIYFDHYVAEKSGN